MQPASLDSTGQRRGSSALAVFGPRSWSRPEQFAVARLPMRATLHPFPDDTVAATVDRSASPWFHSLDGDDWSFRLRGRPEDVSLDDVAPASAGAAEQWQRAIVPSCWTMDPDVDDWPHYTNVQMPFALEPPAVPDDNPTGVYRKRFRLRDGWESRRTVVHVGGAESCLYVFCNGEAVGMGKDSRLSQEFDLTPHVRSGENTLVLVVVRWSDGSWLEDQDHWWMAGLHREVYLYSTGHTHIADVNVTADLDDDISTGLVSVEVSVGFGTVEEGWRVETTLLEPSGTAINNQPLSADVPVFDRSSPTAETVSAYLYEGPVARFNETIPDVTPWSSERPARYAVVLSLIDPSGSLVEATALRVAFRRVEVADRELLLHG